MIIVRLNRKKLQVKVNRSMAKLYGFRSLRELKNSKIFQIFFKLFGYYPQWINLKQK